MKKGNKIRAREVADRDTAAAAIGHAVLDCPPPAQIEAIDLILRELQVQHSRSDLILAMADRRIAPRPDFQSEFDAEVTADRERRERQAESARIAREELAEFRKWKAERKRAAGQ